MKVVADANIIFSALISLDSSFRDVLLMEEHQFFAPNFIFLELFKHKEKLQRFSKLSEDELLEYLNKILESIHFVNPSLLSLDNRRQAYQLCKLVDEKDAIYVALCLELDASLWTGDKKLKNHLNDQGFIDFFNPA